MSLQFKLYLIKVKLSMTTVNIHLLYFDDYSCTIAFCTGGGGGVLHTGFYH